MIRVALVQTSPVFLKNEDNWASIRKMIDQVDADIYVLPELSLSGYAFSTTDELAAVALSHDHPLIRDIIDYTATRRIAICGGYAEAAVDGRFFNSAFFIGRGRFLANYRKTHLFYREKTFFTPGDSGFVTLEYDGTRYGIMVCFDWVFPEAARTLALGGAQVIVHPSNLVLPYCQKAMFARSVENRVYIATVNRVGRETNSFGDDLTFTGESQIVSPRGEYLTKLSLTDPEIAAIEIDPSTADDKMITEFNTVHGDLRPDMYRQAVRAAE